ncbi:mannose-ethanolamine phosphotransferase gpi13, partial [Spiromyces aspiralis]
ARADPPTTTLQRLKGITTGQLPTFIDAGKNFAGTAIEEDNWVAQMLSAPTCRPDRLCKGGQSSPRIPRPRNTVFLGDDTWVATFPQFSPDRLSMRHDGKPQCGWNLYRPMPSLNVWDLETVDDGIITRLPYLMLPPVAEGAGDAHVSESWAIWRSLVAQEHMWDDPDFYGQSNSTLDVGDISPLVRGDLYDSWDLIIAHTLGVDHCGHRFGPGRPQMATKLDQMNTLISLMIDALDRAAEITGDYDTVLYIMGDHGMDLMGDHGGESDMELDAAMFVYSPRWGWNAQRGNRRAARVMAAMTERLSVNSLRDEVADDLTSAWWDNHYVEPATPLRSLSQIDMVSTLSMTLGLPIPFNNLGAVIPELVANDVVKLLYSPEGGNHNTVEEWGLLRALRLNSHQLLAYLQRYMQTSKFHGFSDDSVRLWYRLFGAAEAAYAELDKTRQEPGRDVEALEEETAIRYYLFLRVCLSALRRVWAQFDIPLIGLGLLVLTTSVALVGRCIYLLKVGVPDSRPLLGITTTGLGANVAACLSITGGIITAWVMARLHSNAATWEALVGGAVASLLATELLCCLISSVRGPKPSSSKSAHLSPSLGHQNRFPASSPHPFVRYDQILTTIALAMLMVHSLMFASNSFVSLEDVSVLYITQTLAFALLLCALAAPSPPSIVTVPVYNRPKYRAVFCAAALLLISRISRISVVCREELASICVPTFYGGSASSTVSSVPLALANLSTVAVVPLVVRFALARSKSHTAPIVR